MTKVVTNANCYGSADGSINLSVSGGTPAYTYLWSNGFTGQDPRACCWYLHRNGNRQPRMYKNDFSNSRATYKHCTDIHHG
ncbi:MAG: SprB repeat-containing protein [Lewinellaceae bacterium]|nr:SprB repeat-containing protein [Lewinellaceae bacterium]